MRLVALLVCVVSCSSGSKSVVKDSVLEKLRVDSFGPESIVPGTKALVTGDGFVSESFGKMTLVIEVSGEAITLEPEFVTRNQLAAEITEQVVEKLGNSTTVSVRVIATSYLNGLDYESATRQVAVAASTTIVPRIETIELQALTFVGDNIAVSGQNFLISDGEGQTEAVVSGCMRIGTLCEQVTTSIPLVPSSRSVGVFAIPPELTGIYEGDFEGEIFLRNRSSYGDTSGSSKSLNFSMSEAIFGDADGSAASLGQFWSFSGGGFLPQSPNSSTVIEFQGTVNGVAEQLVLVPEVANGRSVRYLINESDILDSLVDLRGAGGTLQGDFRLVVSYNSEQVVTSSKNVTLIVSPIKQVVYLNFTQGFHESLRYFGIDIAELEIREYVAQAMVRHYEGINVDVRIAPPSDTALYTTIEITGADPNGLSLLGHDNSPGKDVGNERLFDNVGGVNAQTQQDGFPGYGGIFIESLLGFSFHPGNLTETLDGANPLFDEIFDEFRTSRGGQELETIPTEISVEGCASAKSRTEKATCSIAMLGELIAATASHELGHALGLAQPFDSGFHNEGDEPGRIMDSAGNRDFMERIGLGTTPVFCESAFTYLRDILPGEAAETIVRPHCD